ncbi:hypothetical protein CHUAL_013008 [Chamberlinius hualienensis]
MRYEMMWLQPKSSGSNPSPANNIFLNLDEEIVDETNFIRKSDVVLKGAVVAREYGLLCLIAVGNARKLFRSGDEGLLDATKGTIELISNFSTTVFKLSF